MKIKSLIPVFLVLLCGPFFSCDSLKKLDDVTFDVTLAVPFVVNETAVNTGGKAYSSSQLLNLNSDTEVAKYSKKITEFKVNKITYTISGANPTTVLFTNGLLKISSSGKTIASASSISLSNTSETQLTTDATGINELASLLLDDKQELILLQGTLSQTPVTFTVNFKFYLTTTASAL
jgi:hypothetical protein